METPRRNAAEHENACARVATRFSQRWLRNYVRGKLRRDRIYQSAYDLLGSSAAPILDVGCGVGLLAFYLRERACPQPVLGLDVDSRKIGYGAKIAAGLYRPSTRLIGRSLETVIVAVTGTWEVSGPGGPLTLVHCTRCGLTQPGSWRRRSTQPSRAPGGPPSPPATTSCAPAHKAGPGSSWPGAANRLKRPRPTSAAAQVRALPKLAVIVIKAAPLSGVPLQPAASG